MSNSLPADQPSCGGNIFIPKTSNISYLGLNALFPNSLFLYTLYIHIKRCTCK